MRTLRRTFFALAATLSLLATAPVADGARTDYGRQVFNVLPPGQSGSFPPVPNSTDQIPLWDGLTPLFDKVRASDVRKYFKLARFGASGETTAVETGRDGLTVERDRYGVPHITGATRADVMFGAGYMTVLDRAAFMETIRGPSRLAALDAPGIDPFAVATSLRRFDSSAQTEQFLASQITRLRSQFGARATRVLKDVDAFTAGINAALKAINSPARPWNRNDVLAITALIGAVFGRGGGAEVRNAQFLSALQGQLGAADGLKVFRDLKEVNDPEAPVTIERSFPYDQVPRGATPGSPAVDNGSFSPAAKQAADAHVAGKQQMSNALLVGAKRSATGRPLAVMGPQVGMFYPQFLLELDLHGGGIDVRGAAFPGVSLYALVGRAKDYAWSATSSGSDNIDQFLEELCNPDGSPPTRDSTSYRHKGECRPMTTFNAGIIRAGAGQPDQEVVFRETVHGPVSGTVTVGGRPYAVALKRSTRGREGAATLVIEDLNTNRIRSAKDFLRSANQLEFTFNFHYVDDHDVAFFSTGRLPIRAKGVDPSLPTLGTGEYEWRGFLKASQHPQGINPKSGRILNWNNKPAREFAAADSEYSYGSVHRVELFDGFRKRSQLHDVVAVMNKAATQDLRAEEVWPVIQAVLAGGPAPDPLTQQAADLVTDWVRTGSSRLDRALDGGIDHAGAAIIDGAWPRLAEAVLSPVLGPLTTQLATLIGRGGGQPGTQAGAFGGGWYVYVDKDLRSLLGRPVRGPFSRRYCGGGNLEACRNSLWAALKERVDELVAEQGPDPNAWRANATAERVAFRSIGFPQTMRFANRPGFQQVVEFKGHR